MTIPTRFYLVLFIAASFCLAAQPADDNAPVFRFEDEPTKVVKDDQTLNKGIKAMSDGIFNIAADFFREYRTNVEPHEPDFAKATAYLAESLMEQNLLKDAEAVLLDHQMKSAGLKDTQQKARLAYIYAQICFRQHRYDDCIKHLQPLVKPDAEPAFLEKATILCADAYALKQDWQAVQKTLLDFLLIPDMDKHNFDIQIRLSKVHLLMKNPQAAEAVLGNLAVNNPQAAENLTYKLTKILCLAVRKKVDGALDNYNAIASQCPDTANLDWWEVLWTLADALYQEKKFAAMESVLANAIKTAVKDEQRIAVKLLLAKAQIELKKSSQAQDTLDWICKNHPEYPALNEVMFRLAQLYQENNACRTAAELFGTLAKNERNPPELRLKAALGRAESLVADGQWQKAIDTYRQAETIATAPADKAQALFQAAELAEKITDSKQTTTLYAEVADKYPQSPLAPEARLRQGNALVGRKEFQAAAETFKQFTIDFPQHPQCPQAKLQLGTALRHAAATNDNARNAAEYLKQIAQSMPDSNQAAQALLEAFMAAQNARDTKLACDMLDLLIEKHQDAEGYSQALYQRVFIKLSLADNAAAIADAEEFFKQFPQNPLAADLYINIGDLYASQSKWEQAKQYYLRLHHSLPQSRLDAMALYEAARCAYQLALENEKDEDHLEAALEILAAIKPLSEDALDRKPTPQELRFTAQSFMLKGDILSELHQYEAARGAFIDAMKQAGSGDLCYAALGRQGEMCLLLAGTDTTKNKDDAMLQKAEDCFKEILDKKSSASRELRDMASYRLGVCYSRRHEEEYDKLALETYRKLFYDYCASQSTKQYRSWFYCAKSAMAAAELLEKQGDKESLRQAMRLYKDMAACNLPVSKTAAARAATISKAHGFDK